jgi:hypothetical protein
MVWIDFDWSKQPQPGTTLYARVPLSSDATKRPLCGS